MQKRFEQTLSKWIVDANTAVAGVQRPTFQDVLIEAGSACKVPDSRKIHDTIVFLDHNYKLNLHDLLQDVTSVSLVLDMWKSGDKYGSWFVCCCVQFIDSLNKGQNYILNFKHLKKDSQTGEYYASEILKITEAYDITYTIHSIVLDSARSNIKFGDVFAESVTKAAKNHPHSETLEPLIVFKGKESLVRCSAHIIHNVTLSFIHIFASTIIEITGKESWKDSTREELEKMDSLTATRALTDQERTELVQIATASLESDVDGGNFEEYMLAQHQMALEEDTSIDTDSLSRYEGETSNSGFDEYMNGTVGFHAQFDPALDWGILPNADGTEFEEAVKKLPGVQFDTANILLRIRNFHQGNQTLHERLDKSCAET